MNDKSKDYLSVFIALLMTIGIGLLGLFLLFLVFLFWFLLGYFLGKGIVFVLHINYPYLPIITGFMTLGYGLLKRIK